MIIPNVTPIVTPDVAPTNTPFFHPNTRTIKILNIFLIENPNIDKPLLTTIGYFLDKCDPDVRKDIIDRLVNLQTGVEEVKDYKVIDEDMLFDVRIAMDEEMER